MSDRIAHKGFDITSIMVNKLSSVPFTQAILLTTLPSCTCWTSFQRNCCSIKNDL